MIFVKISQNFIKSHLKICLISQTLVHSLWHVWYGVHISNSFQDIRQNDVHAANGFKI